jgi:CRP-like cAMP-binding protein
LIAARAPWEDRRMDEAQLNSIPLFSGLSKEQRRQLARVADEVDVEEGKHLVDEGEFAWEFFAIEEGTAEVRRDDERIADLGPGDFLGEMGALDHSRRRATVAATSPMKVMVLTDYDLRHVINRMPDVADQLVAACKERTAALAV